MNSCTIMIAYSNPASDEYEDEYNRWYDEVHVPQVLSLRGYMAASRYRLSDDQGAQVGLPRYVGVYDLEDDDVESCLDDLAVAVSDGRVELSPASLAEPVPLIMAIYRESAPRRSMVGLK